MKKGKREIEGKGKRKIKGKGMRKRKGKIKGKRVGERKRKRMRMREGKRKRKGEVKKLVFVVVIKERFFKVSLVLGIFVVVVDVVFIFCFLLY